MKKNKPEQWNKEKAYSKKKQENGIPEQRISFNGRSCDVCGKTLEQIEQDKEDVLIHMNKHVKQKPEQKPQEWQELLASLLKTPDGFEIEMNGKQFRQAIQQAREETIRDIRNWTKGKEVTKDKLRQYLNEKDK